MRVNPGGSPTKAHILPRAKWWWLGLALLLLLAGWLYLRGYKVGLPYLHQVDEWIHLTAAQHIVDFGTARGIRNHDAYPPGINAVNYLILKHVKPPDAHHVTMAPTLRLINISAWLGAVALMALLGSLIARPMTGLMAAAIWIVNPWVVERAHFNLPDGYMTFFALLSLWLALTGALHRRRSFNTAATYSILLAACFKTQALFVAPLVIMLPLVNWQRDPGGRKEAGEQVFWNCVRFGVFLFWYALLTRTLEGGRQYPFPLHYSELALPTPPVMWANLEQALAVFWRLETWLAAGLLSMLLWRYRRGLNGRAIITLCLATLALLFGLSLFGSQHIRQFFALGALLCLLYALALSSLLYLADESLARGRVPTRVAYFAAPGLLAMLLAVGLWPAYQASDALTFNYTLHDRRNDLAQYMDRSVPPGVYGTSHNIHKVFMRDIGVYTGVHDFKWYPDHFWLPNKPIEEWRALGVEYAILPHWRMLENPNIYYPDETTLLKTYPVDPNFRGPDMVVLRLYPMQHTHGGQLGPIRLAGYDLNATQLQAGDKIVFRHYWQAETATDTAQHVFNHLLDETGEIIAQADYVPLWDNRRDTTTWDDPDEIMLGREFTLSLPPDLPPGTYQLISGWYDPVTWQRLQSPTGEDSLLISELEVLGQ